MNLEERVTELEIQFMHQDGIIADLDEVIISQQKAIDKLESRLLKLEAKLKTASQSIVKDPSEETPPPHY